MRNPPRLQSAVIQALESRVLFDASPLVGIPAVVLGPQASAGLSAVAGTGITSEYFTGDNFQIPVAVGTTPGVNFNWRFGRPVRAVPAGVFTAKWTGQIAPVVSDTYTFYTDSDSGTRVIINGTTVIDNFTSRTPAVASGSVALTANTPVSIEVDYVSPGAHSDRIKLLWSSSTIAKQVVPASVLTPATVALPAEALTGTYYLGPNFNKQILTEADTRIDFASAQTVPDSLIPAGDGFSVRWIGDGHCPGHR